MSNNFINSDIDDLLSSIQSNTGPLLQWLNIIDNNDPSNNDSSNLTNNQSNDVLSETSENIFMNNNQVFSATSANDDATSDFQVQNGGFMSATSSDINDIFIGQLGGNNNSKLSASPDDINNLIDMLTTEKVNDNLDTVTSITNTHVLENQLRELLNNANTQKGGAKKSSKKSSKKKSKKSSKKTSKKSSKKKYSKKHKNEETPVEATSESPAPAPVKKKRAPNPALLAFGKLSKHVSEKLGIPNGRYAKQIAGAANREIKAKHPDLSAVEVGAKAATHFDANIERFKKLYEQLLVKK